MSLVIPTETETCVKFFYFILFKLYFTVSSVLCCVFIFYKKNNVVCAIETFGFAIINQVVVFVVSSSSVVSLPRIGYGWKIFRLCN